MKAGGMLFALIFLLAYGSALSPIDYCFHVPVKVDTQPGCPQGKNLEQAEVYIGEEFHICGTFYSNSQLNAYEPELIGNKSMSTSAQGTFELKGTAGNEHKVYNIQLNSPSCEEIPPIMLEIKDKCDLVPPAVSVLPENAIHEGKEFTLNIANSKRNLDITINGLTETIETQIPKGQNWSRKFQSTQCCQQIPCECNIKFSFTDSNHPLCKDDVTQLKITIKEKNQDITPKTDNLLIMAAVAVIIIGTAAVVAYNRTK